MKKDLEKDFDDCIGKVEKTNTLADVFGFAFTPQTEEEALTELMNRNYQIAMKAWKGMPEYESKKIKEKKLIINFENEDDIVGFGKLIGIDLSLKTKSIYWPPKEKEENSAFRWISDEE